MMEFEIYTLYMIYMYIYIYIYRLHVYVPLEEFGSFSARHSLEPGTPLCRRPAIGCRVMPNDSGMI